jgi:hypothetical protein
VALGSAPLLSLPPTPRALCCACDHDVRPPNADDDADDAAPA